MPMLDGPGRARNNNVRALEPLTNSGACVLRGEVDGHWSAGRLGVMNDTQTVAVRVMSSENYSFTFERIPIPLKFKLVEQKHQHVKVYYS